QVFIAVLFVSLERDRAVPFLLSHREKFFRREGHQRHVPQKPDVSVTTERRLLRKLRQLFFELRWNFSSASAARSHAPFNSFCLRVVDPASAVVILRRRSRIPPSAWFAPLANGAGG